MRAWDILITELIIYLCWDLNAPYSLLIILLLVICVEETYNSNKFWNHDW